MSTHGAVHEHEHHDHHGPAHGITRWLFTTNHKDIGTLYLFFSLLMFFIGGSFAMGIRAELMQPGLQFVDPMRFNQMTTVHALIMIFGAIMPAFVGLANWQIPLMVGAPCASYATTLRLEPLDAISSALCILCDHATIGAS